MTADTETHLTYTPNPVRVVLGAGAIAELATEAMRLGVASRTGLDTEFGLGVHDGNMPRPEACGEQHQLGRCRAYRPVSPGRTFPTMHRTRRANRQSWSEGHRP